MSLAHAGPAAAGARPAVTADAVLDAALTLFAERGYHGTAVSQIAASLGIRTPSLYNHMRSKHDLLEAIIGRTVDGVLDDVAVASAGLTRCRSRAPRRPCPGRGFQLCLPPASLRRNMSSEAPNPGRQTWQRHQAVCQLA